MNTTFALWLLLISLIIVSAFFSGSETGMMALNRYRLRHLARKGNLTARRVKKLLDRPDRLLGTILLGNTFANVLASSVATMVAVKALGEVGVVVATIVLTMVILVFAEAVPKTWAALYPQTIAFSLSGALSVCMRVLYPLVWFINVCANGLLRLCNVKLDHPRAEALTVDELRTVVLEASGKISAAHQQMLLRMLALEEATVDVVMIPRAEIKGIDITDDWALIKEGLLVNTHQYLPLYREAIDDVVGVLNTRKVLSRIHQDDFSVHDLVRLADDIYYVPEMTFLNHQLLNFQQENRSVGMVIDEYGDIQGLVTLQDILEEVVGQFAVDVSDTERLIRRQKDASFLADASVNVRDFNRITGWELPETGPRTLSGLIIEELEMIPARGLCLEIAGYKIELVKLSPNRVRTVRVWPKSQQ